MSIHLTTSLIHLLYTCRTCKELTLINSPSILICGESKEERGLWGHRGGGGGGGGCASYTSFGSGLMESDRDCFIGAPGVWWWGQVWKGAPAWPVPWVRCEEGGKEKVGGTEGKEGKRNVGKGRRGKGNRKEGKGKSGRRRRRSSKIRRKEKGWDGKSESTASRGLNICKVTYR